MIFWLACGTPPDPELLSRRASLEAWERGRDLLAVDPAGARAAFQEARQAHDDPLLAAWQARAAAAGGDNEGAIALYREALAGDPELAEARYRLGVVLARSGHPAEAAVELRGAIDGGAARTLELLEDPELLPFLGDPAFDFVPRQPLTVALDPLPATAFWGSELTLSVKLLGLVRPPFGVVSAPITGPVELVSVLQEDVATSQGPGQLVRVVLRVVGAGEIGVGPLVFAAGDRQAPSERFVVVASAPPGREGTAVPELRLRLPDELPTTEGEVGARVVDGELIVVSGPTDRVVVDPSPGEAIVYERRTPEAVRRWSVFSLPVGAPPPTVRVSSRGGELRFDGAPAGG